MSSQRRLTLFQTLSALPAPQYAYRYRDDYRYVFWVRADTELELTSGNGAIAQRLNLPLKDAEKQTVRCCENLAKVREW